MITDKLNEFAVAQADVRNAGTYLCGKSIDLGARGYQATNPPEILVRIGNAFAGGTSVNFQLVMADDAALTSNLVVLASSGAILDAALTANSIAWQARLPLGKITKRYLGMQAVGVGTHTGGDFDARLVEDIPTGAY